MSDTQSERGTPKGARTSRCQTLNIADIFEGGTSTIYIVAAGKGLGHALSDTKCTRTTAPIVEGLEVNNTYNNMRYTVKYQGDPNPYWIDKGQCGIPK